MPDLEKDLSRLTDLEREVVERFVTRYSAIVKRAPRFRDTPEPTEPEIRQEALGIVLKQLDQRVAEFRQELMEKRASSPSHSDKGGRTKS